MCKVRVGSFWKFRSLSYLELCVILVVAFALERTKVANISTKEYGRPKSSYGSNGRLCFWTLELLHLLLGLVDTVVGQGEISLL